LGGKHPLTATEVATMFAKLFNVFFGCWHTHLSFPITLRPGARRNLAATMTGTYVVCLDCGAEMPYDWKEMKLAGAPVERRDRVRALATKEAA
jgi:hypothetical protein